MICKYIVNSCLQSGYACDCSQDITGSTGCHWKIPRTQWEWGEHYPSISIINKSMLDFQASHIWWHRVMFNFGKPQRLLIQIPQRMTWGWEGGRCFWGAELGFYATRLICLNLRQGMRIPLQTTPKLGIYLLFVALWAGKTRGFSNKAQGKWWYPLSIW